MQDGRGQGRREARGSSRQRQKGKQRDAKKKLARLASAVGNDEIQRRIQQGNASRDMMLAYLCERLRTMRQLQVRELALTQRNAHFDWWRKVADAHKTEYTKPEPTRWHQAALLYEQAALALCSGDLGRGRHLLDDAIAEEQARLDDLTELVSDDDMEIWTRPDPGFLQELAEQETCGVCAPPEELALADEIRSVTTEIEDLPNRKRRRDPWWTLDEDEEEEEGGGDGGGGP